MFIQCSFEKGTMQLVITTQSHDPPRIFIIVVSIIVSFTFNCNFSFLNHFKFAFNCNFRIVILAF